MNLGKNVQLHVNFSDKLYAPSYGTLSDNILWIKVDQYTGLLPYETIINKLLRPLASMLFFSLERGLLLYNKEDIVPYLD